MPLFTSGVRTNVQTLMITVPRLVHVIAFVHRADLLVDVLFVESPDLAHQIVDEVLVILQCVEIINPIVVHSVDVPIADEPAKRIVACRGVVNKLDELRARAACLKLSTQYVDGQVCSEGVDEFVGQKVHINKELELSLTSKVSAATSVIALARLGLTCAAVLTIIATATVVVTAVVTAVAAAITLNAVDDRCLRDGGRILLRWLHVVVVEPRKLEANATPIK